jgi:hypothetical protein
MPLIKLKSTIVKFQIIVLLFSMIACSESKSESNEDINQVIIDYGDIDLSFVKNRIEDDLKHFLGCKYVFFFHVDSTFSEQEHYKFLFSSAADFFRLSGDKLLFDQTFEFLPPIENWINQPHSESSNDNCILHFSSVLVSIDRNVFFLYLFVPAQDKYYPFLSVKDDDGNWKTLITGAL